MWWPFSRIGSSGFSSYSTAEEVTHGIDGSGLTAIVTGASSGLGAETARVLALRGVHVIMGVIDMIGAKTIKEAILKEIPIAKVDVMELDLSSMTSIRNFASNFNSSGLSLNILINNAGICAAPFALSKDNIELQFAINYLGHFLLTNMLLDTMKKATSESKKQGRIINVSSIGYRFTYREGIIFDKINDQSSYNNWCAYGQSKLANILHANELARRLKEDGIDITANSVHPGATVSTNIHIHSGLLNGLHKIAWLFGLEKILGYMAKNVQQGEFKFWLTAVYALNQLDRRKVLWKDLEAIHKHQQGPWCVIGDFNNVTKAQDRIGGKAVTESEYIDLLNMMETTGLAEMDTTGEFYTWTNKQVIGTIYSRIDRVLGNLDWFQDNLDTVLTVLPASVSDHALLCVSRKDPIIKNNKNFRLSNCLIEMEGYNDMVKASWSRPTRGSPMVRLWNKLKRLQQDMRRFSKPLSNLKQNLIKAREYLQFAQENLRNNNMNGHRIDRVRKLTKDVINLNEMEEKMLMQRAKVDWIRKGDGNNSFFHAIIKSRNNRRNIYMLQKTDGTLLENQSEIEDEIMDFYKKLMGTEDSQLHHIDIDAMRNGKQVNMEQRRYLVSNITEQDIERALKGIGDDKSPGIDGFGAKFFKASWGDSKSVSMMMETIRKFSDSTGLKVNPAKCQMFFGGMDGCSKENLRRITDFAEGKLPIQQHWDQALSRQKFPMSAMYHGLTEEHQRVSWRSVMCGNKARPRAVICLWLACHKKLSTKDRLRRFRMIQSSDCSICNCADESINHLFFNCSGTREIWGNILDWLGRRHDPREWDMELAWIIENTKGKGWKSALLKMATAETVYNVWHYRNSMCFGTVVDKQVIERNIIDNIVYRSWQYPTLRSHVAKLMM
ncbi:Short-chain dehydrogenase TIC 32, chloroplastic [Glycine max]|nr:Short-chain dehydrogenase TIC 32, chloroplastic [Glycine max]